MCFPRYRVGTGNEINLSILNLEYLQQKLMTKFSKNLKNSFQGYTGVFWPKLVKNLFLPNIELPQLLPVFKSWLYAKNKNNLVADADNEC